MRRRKRTPENFEREREPQKEKLSSKKEEKKLENYKNKVAPQPVSHLFSNIDRVHGQTSVLNNQQFIHYQKNNFLLFHFVELADYHTLWK